MLLLTVGTTNFDALVQSVDRIEFLEMIKTLGIDHLRLQIGSGKYIPSSIVRNKMNIRVDYYRYKADYLEDVKRAECIISHAGAGSIMDALEHRKKLVVVVNEQLMDNHQQELAEAMSDRGHLIATSVNGLLKALEKVQDFDFRPFDRVNDEAFATLVDDELNRR